MRPIPCDIKAGLLLAALLPMAGCNVQDPGRGPIVLHLSLHDSLKRYDSVQVAIADAARPEDDLEMVRTGRLTSSQIPAYTLTRAKDPFVVKVRGYRGNHQLALETHIYYEAGSKRVVYRSVPPQVPNNWLIGLAPSAGSLSPTFSLDHLEYSLDLPPNTPILYFNLKAVYDGAITTVAGDTLKVSAAPKVFPVRGDTFVVPITVTDLGAPRTYNVKVNPASNKARLDSIWFSAGTLEKPFDPEVSQIVLNIPKGVDTVQVKFWTTDDANTSLILDREPFWAGVAKTVVLSEGTDQQFLNLEVRKAEENKFTYLLAILR